MAVNLEMDGMLQVTDISADWSYLANRPEGWPARPRLLSMKFTPGAVGDKIMVRQRDPGGPEAFYASCENDTEPRIEYYHGTTRLPYVLFSESTLSPGHKLVINLWREP
ncbi:MAG: hypothetical protein WC455_20740 [Dehalococcoidia bacterium]|jgi:hypothetical protein